MQHQPPLMVGRGGGQRQLHCEGTEVLSNTEQSLYEQLGGESKLRGIIDVFVDRVCEDVMIGFFFRDVDRERLKKFEFQFAARFLGADLVYEGRPLGAAHRKHPIMGGQFARRKKILSDVLQEEGVPVNIVDAWLEHTEKLRGQITGDAGSDCAPEAAIARVLGK